MKIDTLDTLKDEELKAIIARAGELLEQRAEERREQAISRIKASIAEAGLTVQDLVSRSKKAAGNKRATATYKTGSRYQHPDNSSQVWEGKGAKPKWLRDLEVGGGRPVELRA